MISANAWLLQQSAENSASASTTLTRPQVESGHNAKSARHNRPFRGSSCPNPNPMTRAASILLLLAASALAAPKPNVILFLVDDMGWMDCGAYGSKYHQTPNMDRFATQAMRFTKPIRSRSCSPTRAYASSPDNTLRGIASPARAAINPPRRRHSLSRKAAPNAPLLMPESKNYLEPSADIPWPKRSTKPDTATGHFGKWHLGATEPHWPERQGFDAAFHAEPKRWTTGNYFPPMVWSLPEHRRRKARSMFPARSPTVRRGIYHGSPHPMKPSNSSPRTPSRPFFRNLWQSASTARGGTRKPTRRNSRT